MKNKKSEYSQAYRKKMREMGMIDYQQSEYQKAIADLDEAIRNFKNVVDEALEISERLEKCVKFLDRIIRKTICLFKGHSFSFPMEADTENQEGFLNFYNSTPRRFFIKECQRCGFMVWSC